MALSLTGRNAIAMSLLVAGFLALQLIGERYPDTFTNVPWNITLAMLGAVLFLFGAGSFFAFRGGFYVRTFLVILVPVITQAILEATVGSDPGYSGLTFLLAVPYAILFFLGAVFVGGPFLVWKDSRGTSHLTPQSRADGP